MIKDSSTYFTFSTHLKSKWTGSANTAHFRAPFQPPYASDRHRSSILTLPPVRSSQSPSRQDTPHSSRQIIQVGIRVENYLSSPIHVRMSGLHLNQRWEFYQVLSHPQLHSSVHYFLFPHTKTGDLRVSTHGSWTHHYWEAGSRFNVEPNPPSTLKALSQSTPLLQSSIKQLTLSSSDAKNGEFEDPGKHWGPGQSIRKDKQVIRTEWIP